MPWCDGCSRYYNPNTMPKDGRCPSCGAPIAEPQEAAKAPWHFKLLVAATVVYLGWRLVQGIEWVLR